MQSPRLSSKEKKMSRRKPIHDIPPHPVGAHNWHVQTVFPGRGILKRGGSEGIYSYALGYLAACEAFQPELEHRLCDAQGITYKVSG